MTLITYQEIQILNAARRTLKTIMERTEIATRTTTAAYSEGAWYRNRGRLIEQARGAEDALFRTLNIASSYCDEDINDWLMHLRVPSVEEYAEELVRLVRIDVEPIHERFGNARSWTDLHDVCDANEYLIDADEFIRHRVRHSEEHIQFCNEAISIAEKALFHGDDD